LSMCYPLINKNGTLFSTQTEHFDEERKSLEGYHSIADEIAPYLLQLYHQIIEQCLLKHSKRCTSQQVSWLYS